MDYSPKGVTSRIPMTPVTPVMLFFFFTGGVQKYFCKGQDKYF